ncbi:hypothetical protein PInf_010233 [Phytophthora infestans]|nr:hypothetical protein PInf_010233 [Phytophthora infestans]
MRACNTLLPTAIVLTSCDALSAHRAQIMNVATSDLISPIESTVQDDNYDRQLRGFYATENTDPVNNQDTAHEDGEERVNVATVLGMGDEAWDDALMRLAYQHWFDGGKTSDGMRLIMDLPAKGEALRHPNWGKYIKYLEFVKEKKKEAADAAAVAALKRRRTYRGWYVDGKTEKDVRKIFGLPATGKAKNHPNWADFQEYLNVH